MFDEFEEIVVLAIVPVVVLETRIVDIFEVAVDVFGEVVFLAMVPDAVERRMVVVFEEADFAAAGLGISENIVPLLL